MKWPWEKLQKEHGFRISHMRDMNGDLIGTWVYSDKSYKAADPKDNVIVWGLSLVNHKDKPSIEIGRRVAFGRFLKALYNCEQSITPNKILVGDITPIQDFKNIFFKMRSNRHHFNSFERKQLK